MRSSARRVRAPLGTRKSEVLRVGTAFLLILTLITVTTSWAQTHVVSPAELQKAAAAASEARAQDQATLTDFLSSPQAERALASVRMDPVQVKRAVATLTDRELHDLALRANQAQANFAAGRLSDRDLLWILVAVAALIVIIVAVR